MKPELELRDAFMAAARMQKKPASQIVREFMRNFVQQINRICGVPSAQG